MAYSSKLFLNEAYQLVEVFPVVLRHQTEGAEKSPTKIIVGRVTEVWIHSRLCTDVVVFTLTARNSQQNSSLYS